MFKTTVWYSTHKNEHPKSRIMMKKRVWKTFKIHARTFFLTKKPNPRG